MRSHWSLVVFTLLIQSSVGSVWCSQITLLTNRGMTGRQLQFQVVFSLCLAVIGLVSALTHLGNAKACFNAIRNIKTSWLSREITTMNAFCGVLFLLVIATFYFPGRVNRWAILIGSLAGILAIISMIRVYQLRTIYSWNHPGTIFSYLGSAFVLGGIQFSIAFQISPFLMAGRHVGSGLTGDIRYVVLFFILGGIGLKTQGINQLCIKEPINHLKTGLIWPFAQGIGVFLWLVQLFMNQDSDMRYFNFILASILLIISEIMQRIQFYHSYQRTRF